MPQPLTAFLKKFLLPLILVSGLILFFATGLHNWLSFAKLAENYGAIKSYIAMNQAQAYGLFFLIYLIAVAFSLPIASLLTLAGGALLGWAGAALILVSATAGAAIVFIAARSIMADFLSAKAGPFLKKLEAGFSENAFHYLLALRLVPIAPFWVVNIVPALLGMRLMPFVIGTFIGIAPGTFVYVYVARGFDHILAQGKAPDLSTLSDIRIIGPLVALGALALLPSLLKWLKARRTNTSSSSTK